MNKVEELEKLQNLKESGVLTDQEFENEKKKILNDTPNNNINPMYKEKNSKKSSKIALTIILSFIIIRCSINSYWSCSLFTYGR